MDSRDELVKQPYVFCGVCFKAEGPFKLTSCAHILCEHHDQNSSECPVCDTKEITTVQLDSKSLPKELRSYFTSFLPSLESIYAIARFQYEGLVDMVNHQKSIITKLNGKIAQQRDVMKSVREELIKAREYKSQINTLKAQVSELTEKNKDLNRQLEARNGRRDPPMGYSNSIPSYVDNANSPSSTANPPILHKDFAYSVQKHIPLRKTVQSSVQKFKQPVSKLQTRQPLHPEPSNRYHRQEKPQPSARSSTEYTGTNSHQYNPFYRGGSSSRNNNNAVPAAKAGAAGIYNPKFPIAQANTRRSIPTRPETLSPFRRLYSSSSGRAMTNHVSSRASIDNGNGTEFSWSVSKR